MQTLSQTTYTLLHHHRAVVVFRGWAKAPALHLQVSLSFLRFLSKPSLHCLAGIPCRLSCFHVVTREVHQSSFRQLMCPAQNHFIFLKFLIMSITFVPSLTHMLVLLFFHVMFSILLSILVCATAGLFFACLRH